MLVRFFQASLVLSIALSTLLSTSHAAKVYHWVDERGVPHYSEKPPRESQSETLNIRSTGRGTASSSTSSETSNLNKEVKTESEEKTETISVADKAKYCQQARALLEQMNGNTQRRFKQPDGSFRKFDQTEITSNKTKANERIADYCN